MSELDALKQTLPAYLDKTGSRNPRRSDRFTNGTPDPNRRMGLPKHLQSFDEMIQREWPGNRSQPTDEEKETFFKLLTFIIQSIPNRP